MKLLTENKAIISIKTPLVFIIKYIIGTFGLFSLAFILIKFPDSSAQGIKNGIDLCFNILIPTLYPFMILTNFFISSGLISAKIPIISKCMNLIFRLPGECASVILFSMIGGLPIGAKMTQGLYEKGILSKEQSNRMMCFCVNPGPAFVITTVGYYMFDSKGTGVLMYVSLIASSLTLGILSRFIGDGKSEYYHNSEATDKSKQKINALQESVTKSSKSLLGICSWVVTFSCISELINQINASEAVIVFLKCILEMTNGSKVASENFPAAVATGVIGFSGICGHFQLMDCMSAVGMKYKHFLVGRIINGSLATVYCNLLIKLFPVANETFSAGIKPEESGISSSVLISGLMVIMAILFIIGDDYTFRKNKNKNI